jgi:opacity protein-like surface antigen
MGSSSLIVSAAAALSVVVSMSAASAADLPAEIYTKAPVRVDPAFNWSGFHVGGHVGGIWGRSRVFDDGVLTESGAPTNGVVGGILAGYNWQTGPVVLGIEGRALLEVLDESVFQCGGLILRDGRVAASSGCGLNPHGEERGNAARLEP